MSRAVHSQGEPSRRSNGTPEGADEDGRHDLRPTPSDATSIPESLAGRWVGEIAGHVGGA